MAKKSNKVFVDSNYFIALQNKNDSLHAKAISDAKKIHSEGKIVVISNFVFLEVITVVSQYLGRQKASAYGRQILRDSAIEMIHVSSQLHEDSWVLFQSINKKNMSFIDCSIIAVMKHCGIGSLLTYDSTNFSSLVKEDEIVLF